MRFSNLILAAGFIGMISPLFANKALAQIEDRVELGGGAVGITHTENFEYVCQVEEKEDGQWRPRKLWLDVDHSRPTPYRLASSWTNDLQKLKGTIGFEFPLISFTRHRCLGLCVDFKINDTLTFSFRQESTGAKRISVSALSPTGEVAVRGECQRNEVH